MKGYFEDYGSLVYYDITEEKKEKIIQKLIGWYATHCYFGEAIMQDDNSQIDAPELLSEIADDIIQFETNHLTGE